MSEPKRIQRKRCRGFKLVSPNGLPVVYVGRPTKWGNPFSLKMPGVFTRKRAVELYRQSERLRMLVESGQIKELEGKNLADWCSLDQPCHADVLLELANSRALRKIEKGAK